MLSASLRAALGLLGGAWLLGAPVMGSSFLPVFASVTQTRMTGTISLPAPRQESDFSLERALRERRSVREFGKAALTPEEVSQLLWAAQGVTSRDGLRTAPSAGALYPLELYLVVGAVRDLDPGVYKYVPAGHKLMKVMTGDLRRPLAAAALGQDSVADAAAVLVFTAVEQRTTRKYGSRGARYVHIETGHAAQNVFLEATALGLAAVVVGAFDDEKVGEVLNLPQGETPLYLMPLGRP
jgi:SagB-type dehydrogenase family enzyme